MILSDGTTEIEIAYADERMLPKIEKSKNYAAKGDVKSQTAGERLNIEVRVACTPAEYRSLLDLLNNGATQYFYTAEETYTALFPDVEFPLAVNVTSPEETFNNRGIYYVKFTLESTERI